MGWFSRTRVPEPLRIVRQVVGERHVMTMDGELVADAKDYVAVVRSLVAITAGALVIDEITCVEEAQARRRLVLRRGAAIHGTLLRGGTDWIDEAGLVALLNAALGDAPGRFVSFRSGHEDQSFSVAYLTQEQAERLQGRVTLDVASIERLWRRGGGEAIPLQRHDPGTLGQTQLGASSSGNLIASAGGDLVRIWDRAAHSERAPVSAGSAKAVAFDHRDRLVVGMARGLRHGERTLGQRITSTLDTDHARKWLVVGALDHEGYDPPSWIEVWDLERDAKKCEWRVGTGTSHVAMSPSAALVASAGESGECAVWTCDGERCFDASMEGPVWGVAFSPDGERIAFGTESGDIVVRDARSGRELGARHVDCVWWLAYGTDRDTLFVAGPNGVTRVDASLQQLELPRDARDFGCVLALPDGCVVASCREGDGARVYLWPR